jgi:hypothetical protein
MEAAITIDRVFPWGRSLDEYQRMFALGEQDLQKRILSCADGPAAFNASMTRSGRRVVSVDPLYRFSAEEIRQRIEATHDLMVQRASNAAHRFVWNDIKSPEHMGAIRMATMNEFLTDYDDGRRDGRYLPYSLPRLDLPDNSFDLALCSHFLFLYSDEFSLSFHLDSILEMLRIAGEARIFPLLDMQGNRSCHVAPLISALQGLGHHPSVERVNYEFQLYGNEMLRVLS